MLIIDKIVDTSGDFRDIVFNHFYEQYETRLYEVKMQLTENDTLDVAEYEHIIENYYKPCLESFDFGNKKTTERYTIEWKFTGKSL